MATVTVEISNSDDMIDSRDVIARIEELEALAVDQSSEGLNLDEDDQDELDALQKLASEAEDYSPDWKYGETLIRDSYFVTYAEDFAGDIGAINADAHWPLNHIDWDAAAEDLQMDYTSVDFDGVDYWVR